MTTITPANKAQLDALIKIVKDAGMNEAAGLLQLGSDEITNELKARESCACFEYLGDNQDCPEHGDIFKNHGPFSDAEIKADYQERADLYAMGMGY